MNFNPITITNEIEKNFTKKSILAEDDVKIFKERLKYFYKCVKDSEGGSGSVMEDSQRGFCKNS